MDNEIPYTLYMILIFALIVAYLFKCVLSIMIRTFSSIKSSPKYIEITSNQISIEKRKKKIIINIDDVDGIQQILNNRLGIISFGEYTIFYNRHKKISFATYFFEKDDEIHNYLMNINKIKNQRKFEDIKLITRKDKLIINDIFTNIIFDYEKMNIIITNWWKFNEKTIYIDMSQIEKVVYGTVNDNYYYFRTVSNKYLDVYKFINKKGKIIEINEAKLYLNNKNINELRKNIYLISIKSNVKFVKHIPNNVYFKKIKI